MFLNVRLSVAPIKMAVPSGNSLLSAVSNSQSNVTIQSGFKITKSKMWCLFHPWKEDGVGFKTK